MFSRYARRTVAVAATLLPALVVLGCDRDSAGPSAADLPTVHFLIPGSPGGGWDASARGTGAALVAAGLIDRASYENLSGGGGGRAMAHLLETSNRQQGTLMVGSTAILISSLRGVMPISVRELTPVASVMGDFGALVVRDDSPFGSWEEVLAAYRSDPTRVKVAGGSVRRGMDHLVASLAFKAAGADPGALRYVTYDTGGKALGGLLSGETELLSTGLGEVLEPMRSQQVRILATTAPSRLPEAPNVVTLMELGYDIEFLNWRGFFGSPALSAEQTDEYDRLLRELVETEAWEEVRRRHGWVTMYKGRDGFDAFLDRQSQELSELLDILERPAGTGS